MGLIHFILDLAGLLLWLNWRARPYDGLAAAVPATLVGTLRRAESRKASRWYFAAALTGLLLLRPVLYCALGPALNWTAQLNLTATSLAFKSDSFQRMLLFSLLSFAVTLAVFFLWLLLFSLLGRGNSEHLAVIRLTRAHLGVVDGWPVGLKLVLPFVAASAGWWLLSWPLSAWGLMPPPASEVARVEQAALVGLSSYLAWKYLVVGLLILHLLHDHIYFGQHPLWQFVDHAAKCLLAPLRSLPLCVGKVDLKPLVGLILVWLLAHTAEHGVRPPARLDERGRPMPPAFEVPGLADLYRHVTR